VTAWLPVRHLAIGICVLASVVGCNPTGQTSHPAASSPSDQATTATYPPTALPSSATPYEGLWLVPVSRETSALCLASARQLGYRVPCPFVLPYGATATCSTVCAEGGRFVLSSDFPAPSDYVGPDGEVGRGTLEIVGYLTTSGSLDCAVIGPEGHFHYYARGIVLNVVHCSDGSLAWWTEGDYTYAVKVAGHDSRDFGLAKLVAGSAVLTGPLSEQKSRRVQPGLS